MNNLDLRQFLNNFLIAIDYPDDKEQFISQFITVVYAETIAELTKTLPTDKQLLLTQTLESAKTPELLQQALNSNFDPNLLNQTLQAISQNNFKEYLQTVMPVLTNDQKVKLQQYFVSAAPQPTV